MMKGDVGDKAPTAHISLDTISTRINLTQIAPMYIPDDWIQDKSDTPIVYKGLYNTTLYFKTSVRPFL